ncbi:hypothetical protein tb265_34640 [Gemmatimonadetes bacterium T265]|nr:hypothetical protein tb265_34640 [Gemmatimonadetes bacterium T265]
MTLRNIAATVRRVRDGHAAVALGNVLACSGLLGFIACSQGGVTEPAPARTARVAPTAAPRADVVAYSGDTLIQTFTYNPATGTSINFANRAQVNIPAAAVCDPRTSGYGKTTWDAKCTPLTTSMSFTVRAWTNSSGNSSAVVSPDVRFVPGKVASLFIAAPSSSPTAKPVIQWCTSAITGCVDEGATDATLTTQYAQAQGVAYRRIKHFSGYNVSWGRAAAPLFRALGRSARADAGLDWSCDGRV